MSTDIYWRDGDTITARCLPADRNGPALNVIKLNPETRWEVTIFPDLEFAKAMRAALDELYPPAAASATSGESEQSWKATIRYAEEHTSEFASAGGADEMIRYSTWEEAETGHAAMVARITNEATTSKR